MKKYLLGIAFAMSSVSLFAQVGIGTSEPKATLDIKANNMTGESTDVDGVLIPRVDRQRAQNMTDVDESTLIYINDITTGDQTVQTKNVDAVGFYFFKKNGTESYWEKLNAGSKAEFAKPEFFYMPSVLLPTDIYDYRIVEIKDPLAEGYTGFYKDGDFYKVDLYSIFKNQFNSPLISSDSNNNTLTKFVLESNQYDYVVTYVDMDLFTDITVSDSGILSYKIDPASIIKNGSFMNIVLKVK